jgi:hypothetical protein
MFRPPLVTRQPPRDPGAAIRSQADVTGINILLHTNPVPFHQTDWPVPAGPRRTFSLYDAGGINILIHTNPVPFHQTDWPVPKGPQPGVVTNRTWVDVGGININLHTNPVPFHQLDWPVPRGPQRSVELLTWLVNLQEGTLGPAPPSPFYQTDWPVPRGRVSHDLRSFLQPLNLAQLASIKPPGAGNEMALGFGLQARSRTYLLFEPPNLLTSTLTPATSGIFDFWHYYSP